MRADVHQHVWTEPLLEALGRRTALPRAVHSGSEWVLHAAGERPYPVDAAADAAPRRTGLLHADGLDAAIVAISTPIGIEALPGEEARMLIAAHLAGVAGLGECFSAWGPVALDGAGTEDVDAVLELGCVGVSLPAGALMGPAALDRLGPVLDRLEVRGVPLFVHPGPGLGPQQPEAVPGEPGWWRALTDYVAQMHAAWLTFAAHGRPRHPDLVVLFAMLAGGAPLLSERLATRGGPTVDIGDPRTFYDSSSYGPVAVEAMAARVGSDQLVYGSDRPVLEPLPTGLDAPLQERGARFLTGATA